MPADFRQGIGGQREKKKREKHLAAGESAGSRPAAGRRPFRAAAFIKTGEGNALPPGIRAQRQEGEVRLPPFPRRAAARMNPGKQAQKSSGKEPLLTEPGGRQTIGPLLARIRDVCRQVETFRRGRLTIGGEFAFRRASRPRRHPWPDGRGPPLPAVSEVSSGWAFSKPEIIGVETGMLRAGDGGDREKAVLGVGAQGGIAVNQHGVSAGRAKAATAWPCSSCIRVSEPPSRRSESCTAT